MTKQEQHALAFGRFAGGNGYAQAHKLDVALMRFWSLERKEGIEAAASAEADRWYYEMPNCGEG